MIASVALATVVIALGLGAFSSLIFAWHWLIGVPTQPFAVVLFAAVAAAGAKTFIHLHRHASDTSLSAGGWWILFCVALVFAGYWMVQQATLRPHGAWDGWAIWNLHARFLYRGGSDAWKAIFDPALFWSHNDYPLLVPGLLHGMWTIAGAERQWIAALVSILFALLALAIVGTATSAISGGQRGCLAALVLLATPSFLSQASAQMADIPLALYVLTTVVLLKFADEWRDLRRPLLTMAGFAAGLAGWTKNEGLVVVVAVFLTHFAVARQGAKRYLQDAAAIAFGLAPMLTLILAFKSFLAPPGDIQLAMPMVERSSQVAYAFLVEILRFGDAPNGMNPGVLMILYLLLYMRPSTGIAVSSFGLLLLPTVMLVSYFAAYLITPHDLDWQLTTSLNRLLLQVWPVCIFVLAILPRPMTADHFAGAAGFKGEHASFPEPACASITTGRNQGQARGNRRG